MILVSLQLCKCAAVLLSLFHVRSVLLSYISCVVLVAGICPVANLLRDDYSKVLLAGISPLMIAR
jgi:hypothetical protein